MRLKLFSVAVVAVLPIAALAQQASSPAKAPTMAKMHAPAAATNVSSSEVVEFSKLYIALHQIQMNYGTKIHAAKDNKTREALQKEGEQKVELAFKQSPMSAQRYDEIARAAAKDSLLKKRLIDTIKKLESK